jgi:hypothetical protein
MHKLAVSTQNDIHMIEDSDTNRMKKIWEFNGHTVRSSFTSNRVDLSMCLNSLTHFKAIGSPAQLKTNRNQSAGMQVVN